MGMREWKSRERANEGARMDVIAPDGKHHGDWMQVRHVWSDAFKRAEEAAQRAAAEAVMGEAKPDKEALAAMQAASRLDILAALVIAWSEPDDCTVEAVRALLEVEPGIADQLDAFAVKRAHFFGSESRKPARGSKAKSA